MVQLEDWVLISDTKNTDGTKIHEAELGTTNECSY
jgi:hypothetical protein